MARLLLRDLTPGTAYKLQVRAVEGDSTSEWSRLFPLSTTSDLTPPDSVAWSVAADFVVDGDTFVATWQPVDLNLEQNKDLDHYELELSDTVKTVILRSNNTAYVLTYEQNRIFFGTPKSTVTARVRSVDANGNASSWNALRSATNPAPAPVNSVTTNALYDSIEVKWDAGTLPDDFKNFLVQVSYTSASSGFTTVYSGPSTGYTHPTISWNTDHYFRVYVVDKFGTLSTVVTSGAVRPKSSFTVDTVAPAVPTALTASIANNATGVGSRASLAWSQAIPAANDLAGFRVRYRKVGDTDYSAIDFSYEDRAGIIELQAAFVNYEFQIRSYDWMGNYSAWTSTVTSVSPGNVAPGKVVGLATVPGRDSMRYTWTPITDADLKEYEVTFAKSADFTNSPITFKTGTAAYLDIGGLTSGTTYYARVRAIDNSNSPGTFSDTNTTATIAQLTPGDIGAPTNAQFNTAVKSYSNEYYLSTSESTQTGGTWSTTPPTRTPGSYIWQRTNVTLQDNSSSYTPPVLTTGNTGAAGSAGVGVTGTAVTYQVSTSGTVAPSGSWVSAPPAVPAGQFLWTRTITSFSDGSSNAANPAYSVAGAGSNGTNGTNGIGITGTVVEYQVGASGTSAPTGAWSGTPVATTAPGQYLWTRTTTSYSSGSPTIAYSISAHGATGSNGTNGTSATGVDVGNDSIAIPVTATGAATAAGTITIPFSGWIGSARAAATVAISGLPAGITLTTNTAATTSADGSIVLSYANGATIGAADTGNITLTITCNGQNFVRLFSWSRAYTGAAGGNGTSATSLDKTPDNLVIPTDASGNALAAGSVVVLLKGLVGSTPSNVTIGTAPSLPAGVTATPANSGTTTAQITFSWSAGANIGGAASSGTFVWPITVNSIVFNATFGWARATGGANGTNGTNGTSITGITPFFAQVTTGSIPTQPTSGTATPSAPWSATEPTYVAGTELWRTERVTYSSGTSPLYTTQSKVSSYAAAVIAMTTANGKNKSFFSTSDASGTADANGVAYINNDLWYKRDANGVIIGTWEFVIGTGWVPRKFGDATLDSLNVGKLVSGDISTALLKITNTGAIQSSDYAPGSLGWKLSNTGLEINKGSVRASALIGDTLGSSTGTINIAAGASIVMNGGYIKSTANTGTTLATAEASGAGFYLDSTGLFIGSNSRIKAGALISDTLSATTITLGTNGKIQGGNGWSLDSSGLTIPNGGVSAQAITLRDGLNIIPATYAGFEDSSYAGKVAATNLIAATNPAAKFGNQSLATIWGTTASNTILYLGTSSADYNLPIEAGVSYIFSAYAWCNGAVPTNFMLKVKWSNGAVTSLNGTGATLPAGGTPTTAVRVSGAATVPAGVTGGLLYVESSTLTANAGYNIDGVQVELQTGGSTTPTPWTPPGSTLVDGGNIRTGTIQSTNTNLINGVNEPVWSIPLNGAATFSAMRVLGNTVLGNGEGDLTSSLSSSNYQLATRGWQLRADGTADLRGLAADSISGKSITVNSLNAAAFGDSLGENGLSAVIQVNGTLQATGEMGEVVAFSADGFQVVGAHETPVVSRSVTSNVATVTTSIPHGYAVGGKVTFSNVGGGLPDSTPFYIVSVPTTTSFTVNVTGQADYATTAIAGVAQGLDVTGTRSKPTYIDFPTDGAKPNIISGVLTASTMVVTGGASLRGVSGIEPGSTLTIGSGILPPKAAPTVNISYSDLSLSQVKNQTPSGITIGHNGNLFVTSNGTNSTLNNVWDVTELNPTTGAVISSSRAGDSVVRTDGLDSFGIVYYNNKYYVLTRIGSRGGVFDMIYVYNTSWTELTNVTITDYNATGATVPSGIALGWNSLTNRLIYAVTDSSGVIVREHAFDANGYPYANPAAGTTVTLASTSTITQLGYVGRGNFDFGGERIVVASSVYSTSDAARNAYVVRTATGATSTNENWPMANNIAPGGAYWSGSQFIDISTTKIRRKYAGGSSAWLGALTQQSWVAYSWYDPSTLGTIPAGGTAATHETTLSPGYGISMAKRGTMAVTIAPIPKGLGDDTPTQARIYHVFATAMPALTSASWVARAIVDYPLTSANIDIANSYTGAPKATNEFGGSSDPGLIQSTTGKSFWKGDDTAQFYQLVVTSTSDVTATAGNTPALRIGDPNAAHLRIDNNEIQAMGSNTTNDVAALILNQGGGRLQLGMGGRQFSSLRMGIFNGNSNASGIATVPHGGSTAPDFVVCTPTLGGTSRAVLLGTLGTTNFTAEIRKLTDGTLLVSAGADFHWVAYWL